MKKSLGALPQLVPCPVFLVGTYDQNNRPNLMTAAWGGICCSKPPCVAVSLRKATYSHGCIVQRKAFTLGIATEDLAQAADFCGMISGREENKFSVTGLTPVASAKVDAPYAAEVPLVLECRLVHTFELGLHTQFVGEIMDVLVDEQLTGIDGKTDISKIKPLIYDVFSQNYHGVGPALGKAFSLGRALSKTSEK